MHLLLADDHPIFRKGLKSLIQDQFEHCVIDEADNGEDAIRLLNVNKYSIVILDIDMPKKSGIEVLQYISENNIKTRPVVLTMHNDELFFNEAFNKGTHGFLLKEDSSIEIVECLESLLNDIPFVSNKLGVFLKNRKQFNSRINNLKSAIKALSNAELNTLKLVAQNKTSKEISELLFVTEKSVENYRSRICKKLDLHGGSNTLYKWSQENRDLILKS